MVFIIFLSLTLLLSTVFGQIDQFSARNVLAKASANRAIASCNGQAYVLRLQLCCDGQLWEDPYGLYTCCGNVPCLTDVGVSLYQVFKGRYTDGVSQYMGNGSPPSDNVNLPPGTTAIQFSRTPMRKPPYLVFNSERVERIQNNAYLLPPAKQSPLYQVLLQQQPQSSAQYVAMEPAEVSYLPAQTQYVEVSPIISQADIDKTPGVQVTSIPSGMAYDTSTPGNKKTPELTIRIETEQIPSSMNRRKHLISQVEGAETIDGIVESPVSASDSNREQRERRQREIDDTNAELLRILRNIETVAHSDDGDELISNFGRRTRSPPRLRPSRQRTTTPYGEEVIEPEEEFLDLIDLIEEPEENPREPAVEHRIVPFWNPHVPPQQDGGAPIAFQPAQRSEQKQNSEPSPHQLVPIGFLPASEANNKMMNNNDVRRRRRYRRRRYY